MNEGLDQRGEGFVAQPIDPNWPEISGTTLPLLSGVLAGFAVTSVVQLALSPEAGDQLGTATTFAVAMLLLSVVLFLNSIVFSIKAQASNYLPFLELSEEARRRLNVADHDAWVRDLERRWFLFQIVAICAFYAGATLFLAGLNVVVWTFVGWLVGAVFLVAVLMMVVSTVLLDVFSTAWMRSRLQR